MAYELIECPCGWFVDPEDPENVARHQAERHPLEPTAAAALDRSTITAARLRHFSRELDMHGNDRDLVARVAGCLLDLAEDLERRK